MSANRDAALLAIPMELQRIMATLESGLSQFHNGQRIEGARPRPADRPLVWGGAGRLVGWSLRSVGGPVLVELRDGRDGDGDVIAVLDLDVDSGNTQWMGPTGVFFGEALSVTLAGAGALSGSFWIAGTD